MMKHYVEFDIETGQIIRRGRCQVRHIPVPRRLNAIALICADYSYNAIVCDKINNKGIAVNPTLARKSFDKRKLKLVKVSSKKQPARITNEQWQGVLKRLKKLETKA